MKKDKKNS